MAEFRPLDDGALSGVTGQAGVTIELETRLSMDRFSWIDEGSLNVNGLRLAGQHDTVLDNMKLTIDIAGDGEVLEHGFSEIARRAQAGLLDLNDPDVADALTKYSVDGSFGKQFGSGDLVMHLGATDYGDPSRLDDYLQAVDFELAVDSVTTSGSEGSATLFSDILLQGHIGPTDLVITNHGTATRPRAKGNGGGRRTGNLLRGRGGMSIRSPGPGMIKGVARYQFVIPVSRPGRDHSATYFAFFSGVIQDMSMSSAKRDRSLA